MGGVYFLTLGVATGPCIVVAKPRVDIRDIFASALADELGAPIVKSIVVKRTDQLFASTLEGILAGHLAQSPGDMETAKVLVEGFMEAYAANWQDKENDGYIQLMEKSVGKDPYNYLKGFQYEACKKCKDAAVAEEIKAMNYEEEIQQKIEEYASKVRNGSALSSFGNTRKMFETALGTDFAEEPENEGEKQLKREENAHRLRAWMLEHPKNRLNQLRSLLERQEADKEKKMNLYDCDGRNGAEEQPSDTVEERLEYVRNSFRDRTKELGTLSAFLSIVGENDNIPAPSWPTPMANMMNVMVSPGHIEGIDIRVGGAADIPLERDGSSPYTGSIKNFLLIQALRQSSCKKSPVSDIGPDSVGDVELALRLRLSIPFFSGAYHNYAKQCYLETGSIFEEGEVKQIASSVTEETSRVLRDLMGKVKSAIAMTVARLSSVGTSNELRDIVGWLMHRVDLFQAEMDEVDALCSPGLPNFNHATPFVNETHGSSVGGKAPPLPPSFDKHSDKMGYVWHTVETMWKKAHGQWFGTRTTDIVAVPLQPVV